MRAHLAIIEVGIGVGGWWVMSAHLAIIEVRIGVGGIFVDLSWVCIANTSATAVRVDFRPATAGTVGLSVMAPAGVNVLIPFTEVPFLQTTANNNWTVQLGAAVTDVRISAGSLKRLA